MKRFLSLILAMLVVTALFVPSSAAYADTDTGMVTSTGMLYPLEGQFTDAPMTFEAVIRVTTPQTSGRQVIFSNYNWENPNNGIVFALATTCVELIFGNSDGNQYEVKFAQINPQNLTNQWIHIAVVRDDGEGEFRAYLNGEFAGIGETTVFNKTTKVEEMKSYGFSSSSTDKFYVGSDTHGKNNSWRFKHEIAEIAVYSDVRSATEIAADAVTTQYDKDMLVWLRLPSGTTTAPDLSGNSNHMGIQKGVAGVSTSGNYVTVTFDSKGGTTVAPQAFVSGGTATKPTNPEKDDYKFLGWFAEGAAAAYDFSAPVTTNLTLTAKWAETYTVTFDANGGSGSMDSETGILGDYTLPECRFAAPTTGKQFKAWLVDGAEQKEGAVITVSTDTKVTAVWEDIPDDSCKVTFIVEGSTYKEESVKKDNTVSAPALGEKEGYTFLGWFAEDATVPYDFENTPVTTDLTLTAEWKIKTYKVTFINEGVEYAKANVDHGGAVNAPDPAPTKTGYAFDGWFLDESSCDFPYTVESDLTFTAKWVKDAYTVKFINDGKETSKTVNYDEKVAKPEDPTKTGYKFLGWFVSETATTPYDFDTKVTGNLTLTARWAVDTTAVFTVTFDTNGGDLDSSDPQPVKYGEFAADPGTPWKKGCEFRGWYNGNAEYNFETTPVTADLTLTAMWKVDAQNTGMAFPDTKLYPLANDFDQAPMTIEARIYIPAGVSIQSNVSVFSNNVDANGLANKKNLIALDMMGTCFRLTYVPADKNTANYVFFKINPNDLKGKISHIAVVNTGNQFLAYLNGGAPVVGYHGTGSSSPDWTTPAKPEIYGYTTNNDCPRTFYVGGCQYSGNNRHFPYFISEIAAYSVARSASEIKADADGTPDVNDTMLVWLQLSEDSNEYGAADLSLNNNNMKNHKGEYVGPAPKPDFTTKPSENIFTSPLFALAALYAQRFDVVLVGENCSISGDTMIKYKRSGVIEISVDEGYELVDVMLDGKPLGPVTKVDIKKVTRTPELVVITRAVADGN